MASYNAVPESEQLLNKTPKTKSWKRIATGAAVASFVLGCLAVTAVKSSVGLRGATSLKHHKTGTRAFCSADSGSQVGPVSLKIWAARDANLNSEALAVI